MKSIKALLLIMTVPDFGEINSEFYVLLTADGYYFNEVYGELSDGQISMQSIVNLTDNKQANVIILTHLKTAMYDAAYQKQYHGF